MNQNRESRILALQLLYSSKYIEINFDNFDGTSFFDNQNLEVNLEKSKELINGLILKKKEVDELISESLLNWKHNRLSYIDNCILELGSIELMINFELHSFVINEYIEISKIFSEKKSPAFINGVLDSIRTRLVDKKKLSIT